MIRGSWEDEEDYYEQYDIDTTLTSGRNNRRMSKTTRNLLTPQVDGLVQGPMRHRGLNKETTTKYDARFKVGKNTLTDATEIQTCVFPYSNEEGSIVAQKIKNCDVILNEDGDKVREKDFYSTGSMNKGLLFGQDKFKPNPKMSITITEGEEDAMACYQLSGNFPAVSLKNGASAAEKDVRENYEYLNGFKEVYIAFDSDDVGRAAAKKVAEMFPAKCKIVDFGAYKDANNLLIQEGNGAVGKYKNIFYNSKEIKTEGILTSQALKDIALSQSEPIKSYPYPWKGLNNMTLGFRLGEYSLWVAEQKVGKTTTLRETIMGALASSEDIKVGAVLLEDTLEKNVKAFVSLQANKPLHLKQQGDEYTDQDKEEYEKNVEDFTWDRIAIIDKSYCKSTGDMINKIKELVHAMDCNYIIVDNIITMVRMAGGGQDERQAMNSLNHELVTLAEDANVHIAAVTHLNREGNIQGSSDLEKAAHLVVRLERDKEAGTVELRNQTHLHVAENRFTGYTGEACVLQYDPETGRQFEFEDEPVGSFSSEDEGITDLSDRFK